ncbi:aspartate/glutamate racemase family protein [Ornithinimicrobium sp. LYQ92]|uniref:aspartate/glutamate racemase family protein n=1 Tax=Serinicoccus sp. LYQ92 TaxID=3378798 RepID=UPI0038550008
MSGGRDERLLPDTWRRPVLGVLGGMGPAATVTFLDALVRATPAARDQDHIDTVVLGHATTPDRTARLQDDTTADPVPYLMGDLELLGRLGADLAVIVCNTAHAFLPADLPVPLLSLIEVGARGAVRAAGGPGGADGAGAGGGDAARRPRVMLLATDGTRGSGLYQRALEAAGAQVLLPEAAGQAEVMAVIYQGVKAGVEVPTGDFLDLVGRLRGDADAVLLGCTELSVLADQAGDGLPYDVVDAQAALVTEVLATLIPS